MSVMVTLMTSEMFLFVCFFFGKSYKNVLQYEMFYVRQLQCLYACQFNHNTVLIMKINNYEEIADLPYIFLVIHCEMIENGK